MANNSQGYWWPDFFDKEEILPPHNILGDPWKAVRLMSKELAEGLDAVRKLIDKPLFINTWDMLDASRAKFGLRRDPYFFSGFRPLTCQEGAQYSLHKFMKAFDLKCPSMSTGDLYAKIIAYWKVTPELQVFTEIEDIQCTPTWVHIAQSNRISDNITIIKPIH